MFVDVAKIQITAGDGGDGAVAFRVGDNDGFAAFHNGNAAIGST